jgi:hypothetical protein
LLKVVKFAPLKAVGKRTAPGASVPERLLVTGFHVQSTASTLLPKLLRSIELTAIDDWAPKTAAAATMLQLKRDSVLFMVLWWGLLGK